MAIKKGGWCGGVMLAMGAWSLACSGTGGAPKTEEDYGTCLTDLAAVYQFDGTLYTFFDSGMEAGGGGCNLTGSMFTVELGGEDSEGNLIATWTGSGTTAFYLSNGTATGDGGTYEERMLPDTYYYIIGDPWSDTRYTVDFLEGGPDECGGSVLTSGELEFAADYSSFTLAYDIDPSWNTTTDSNGCSAFVFSEDGMVFTKVSDGSSAGTRWNAVAGAETCEGVALVEDCPEPADTGDTGDTGTPTNGADLLEAIGPLPEDWDPTWNPARAAMTTVANDWLALQQFQDSVWSQKAALKFEGYFKPGTGGAQPAVLGLLGPTILAKPVPLEGNPTVQQALPVLKHKALERLPVLAQPENAMYREALDMVAEAALQPDADVSLIVWRTLGVLERLPKPQQQ